MGDTEFDIRSRERQMRWEVQNVQRGVEMYRAAERAAQEKKRDGALADTKPGMKMMMAIMPELTRAIRARQQEGVETMKSRGRTPEWVLPILSLEAEKLALITLRSAVGAPDRNITPLALTIGARCQLEREFELFAEAEKQRVKDGRLTQREIDLGMQAPRSVVALIEQYADDVSERTVKAWRKKTDTWESLGWSRDNREHLGGELLHQLAVNGGGWFEIRTVVVRDRGVATVKTLHMTAEAQAWVSRVREIDEINRPWMTPMLCPPSPWINEKEAA